MIIQLGGEQIKLFLGSTDATALRGKEMPENYERTLKDLSQTLARLVNDRKFRNWAGDAAYAIDEADINVRWALELCKPENRERTDHERR